ncbi:uncharacterized protein LOC142573156 [Dermacentor variabilis]|uniref:uncharacterized protein LOC142573156 n=1 Tax=Dermacentor variabilis TaxID=34621 RepID=UPI003F5B3637
MGHYSESLKHEGLRYYFEEASRLDYDQAKEILSFERAARPVYRDAWKEADSLYKVRRKQNPSHRWHVMKKENFVAIMCYTLEQPNICRHFNQLCRAAMPTKESWHSFPFKSLLYFLIKAFNLLPNFHAPVVFRGVDKFVHTKNEAQFVQFLSASARPEQASKFGRGVHLLVLRGVPASLMKDISIYSVYPKHKEVLIWPFCVFKLAAGEEEVVKILEFDREETWTQEDLCGTNTWKSTVTLPESRTHLTIAPSNRIATAKNKSSKRPAISGEQGAFSLDSPSPKGAKTTSRQPTPRTRHVAPPARSSVRRDGLGTPTEAATSTTVATCENRRKVIGKIKQDFVITVPCDSSSEPSFKVFPTVSPRWNGSFDKMGARNNVGQIHAHSQMKIMAASEQTTWDAVISIPSDPIEPSAKVPAGRPTWNARVAAVGSTDIASQTRAHVETKRLVASHEAASRDNGGGSGVPWKGVAAAVFIGLILLLGVGRLLSLERA